MPAPALLPDERLVADAFAAHLGPIETWFDGTFGLRPAGDRRRIRLETSFLYEVARLRPAVRDRIVAAVVAAFTTCQHTVIARLVGGRTLRADQVVDVDVLDLRLDDAPWATVGEIPAA